MFTQLDGELQTIFETAIKNEMHAPSLPKDRREDIKLIHQAIKTYNRAINKFNIAGNIFMESLINSFCKDCAYIKLELRAQEATENLAHIYNLLRLDASLYKTKRVMSVTGPTDNVVYFDYNFKDFNISKGEMAEIENRFTKFQEKYAKKSAEIEK